MKNFMDKASGSLMMSAECPLDCEYCYIGKNSSLGEVDQKIIDEFKNKGILNKLKESYDDELERLGLWGSEPTLYLQYFNKDIEGILKHFTGLGSIMISSNFYLRNSAEKLVDLVKEINDNLDDRKFELDIQTSIDGPPEWTDKTRKSRDGGPTTDSIIENLEYMVREISKLDLKSNFIVKSKFKSTVQMRFFRQMAEDNDKLIRYFKFFDKLWSVYGQFKEDLDSNFKSSVTSGAPTLVAPGEYTVDDGKVFAEYIDDIKNLIIRNRKDRIIKHFNLLAGLPYMGELVDALRKDVVREQNQAFSCGASARGFSIGIDNEGHICHRVYLHNQDEYFDLMLADKDKYEAGRLKKFRENLVVDDIHEEPQEFLRQQYAIKGWRDFAQQRYNFNYATIKFLSKIGQADSIYREDDEMAKLASRFLMRVPLCVVESILQTGSFHLTPMQGIKLWTNGALTSLIEARRELIERGIL